MGDKELFLRLFLFLGFSTGLLGSLCGTYQRKFCLESLMVYLGRGGGTYSGMAKLGQGTVEKMCGFFYNDTVPCLSSMRPHCQPVEEAELQGEIDLHEYICKDGRRELYETAQCLASFEPGTDTCKFDFEVSRKDTNSLLNQRKIDDDGARQETCEHLETLSTCVYGKVTACGPTHARWMQSVYDMRMEPLRRHLDCSGALGLNGISTGLFATSAWVLMSRILSYHLY